MLNKSVIDGLPLQILFPRLWEISENGMRLTDGAGKIIMVNPAFCRIIEKSEKQLLGKPFTKVYASEDRAWIMKLYKENFSKDSIEKFYDNERVLWNYKKKWLEFSNAYLELQPIGKLRLSIINDITQRKEAELALKQSEGRHRRLLNHLKDAVMVCYNLPDNRFGPFVEVNEAASRLMVYSRQDLLKRNIYNALPQRELKAFESAAEKFFESGDAMLETYLLNNHRKLIPVEINMHLFEFNNRPSTLFITRNISANKETESKMQAGRQQLRNLAGRLQNIREEERTAIAREIHDELGQVLSVLKIRIALLAKKYKPLIPQSDADWQNLLQMVDQSVESVQRISAKLRPGLLDELGLNAAIQWQAQDFIKQTGIPCRCSLPAAEPKIPREHATAIFRILQESLTNVARHANANRVSIFLKWEKQHMTLEVTDNGLGINKDQIINPRSLGLLGMKERAQLLGGIFNIYGSKGTGTNVKVSIPIPNQHNANEDTK